MYEQSRPYGMPKPAKFLEVVSRGYGTLARQKSDNGLEYVVLYESVDGSPRAVGFWCWPEAEPAWEEVANDPTLLSEWDNPPEHGRPPGTLTTVQTVKLEVQ